MRHAQLIHRLRSCCCSWRRSCCSASLLYTRDGVGLLARPTLAAGAHSASHRRASPGRWPARCASRASSSIIRACTWSCTTSSSTRQLRGLCCRPSRLARVTARDAVVDTARCRNAAEQASAAVSAAVPAHRCARHRPDSRALRASERHGGRSEPRAGPRDDHLATTARPRRAVEPSMRSSSTQRRLWLCAPVSRSAWRQCERPLAHEQRAVLALDGKLDGRFDRLEITATAAATERGNGRLRCSRGPTSAGNIAGHVDARSVRARSVAGRSRRSRCATSRSTCRRNPDRIRIAGNVGIPELDSRDLTVDAQRKFCRSRAAHRVG